MRQPVPFGKYLLLDRISVGGMAEVFKAKSYGVEGFEKVIAIKRILPSMGEDRDFIKMFIDEAKIAGQLSHANICQIFELGRIDGAHFIAMEYIWGKDLLQIQNRFRKLKLVMPVQMACFVIAKVCEGLHYAHKARDQLGRALEIVHRDCSPQNVLVSYEGEVKIIDFGIARAASRSSRTNAGVLKGKFGYMSPEQVRGLPLDHRSDIFAVGTILYESLTGQRLFLGESDFSTLEKVRNADVLPPRHLNDSIPAEVERIVMKALQRDQRERYQWCAEMHSDLQRYLTGQEAVFTNKSLGDWLKGNGFAKDVQREKSLMESYKRVGRDGLIAGAPAAKATVDVIESLGEAGPVEGDPTVLGGPSFDDIIDDDALPQSGGNGVPARDEPPRRGGGQRMLVVPMGKSLPDVVDDDDDDGDFDDGPTEIFGEIAGDDIDEIRRKLEEKARSDAAEAESAAERNRNNVVVSESAPRPGSAINPIVPQPGPMSGGGFPGPGYGSGLQSQVVRSLQPGRSYNSQQPPQRPGSMPAPGSSQPMPPGYPPGGSPPSGNYPLQHGQQPYVETPPGGQMPLSPGQNAYPLGSQQLPPVEYPRAQPGTYMPTANVVSLGPAGMTLPPSRRKPSLGKDIAIGVGIAAIVLGGFAAGKYFLFGDSPGPRSGKATLARTGTIALAVGGKGAATVYVDGEKKGVVETESAQLEVDAGEYELKIVRRGYPPCERTVSIEAKKVEVVSCPFTDPPLQGKLVLEGLEVGQRVFVNDEEISSETARAPIELVPDKDHVIVVRQKDTTLFKETIKLEPGQELVRSIQGASAQGSIPETTAQNVELDKPRDKDPPVKVKPPPEPEVGYFISYTTPWARVHIDDVDSGKSTPLGPTQKIALTPGKHKVTFVVGSDKFSYPITITAGQDTRLVRDLPVDK